ncbi:conserved hypothetical protein [Pyrenophora tritici-repentis Pt-1C-BFP]|uniref:Cytochrome b561 domain-containing protein n=1 Tax=Pyrenophora tritici-repentis (strain Pt-1C-BFP) TaxID=426418 RepID=B2WBH0_PYRTR|nr:uncharacterized protein PTRG_06983 [Pyrenophora tritici-repentis Pt-1C-BFP]EDU49902.1 conserved hypothetical protein [Pyrenophora tritici-repentis Pt-1C-BFP]
MSQGLSAPGSSVYSSDTMYVGDGTWDSQRNTFLLPNLQGPNFETMRYNGMGNRFRSMVGYKALITAHGVLAGVTFLFIIPAAIFMARFYHRNPHTALKFHIWLQVLAVLLSTAAIICSFFAVGLERSLTNPHHGIGVALYTLVMVQALGGSVIHRLEKGKERFKIPLKLMFTESYLSDEKYGGNRQKSNTWRDRLLGAGAAAGGIFAMKKLFSRKPKHPPTETGSDFSYSRPLGPSEVTQTDISRLEEGRAPESPANRRDDWRRDNPQASALTESSIGRGPRPARSAGSIDSFDSRTSLSEETEMRPRDHSYGLKEGVATLGVFGFLKHSLSRRSKKKEDDHVEEMRQQDLEEERVARMNSQRRKKYTGDGTPRKGNRPPSTILSESDMTGITPSVARPLPMDSTLTPSINPGGRPPRAGVYSVLSDSASEAYDSPGGRHHSRRRTGDRPIIPAGTAAAATVTSMGSPSKKERRGSRDDVASPPVSVKVKMHNDGRHVTLRRLNEEEAAAERDARRRERKNKARAGSVSSLSAGGGERWRRTEAMERAQAEEMAQQGGIPPPPPGPPPVFNQGQSSAPGQTLFPPPPIPAADTVLSSPPGTQFNGTETDLSNYDSNRRRRRAERAQAKQARLGGGSRVEFS